MNVREIGRNREKDGGKTHTVDSPGCWTASLQIASGPTCDLLLAARWREPLLKNRTLGEEGVAIGRQLRVKKGITTVSM